MDPSVGPVQDDPEQGDPMLGRVLKGQYRIDTVLGRGGMGVVYKGVQLNLGKPVAIKMLLTQKLTAESDYERFKREALLASKLVHPGVAQVFDYGIEERSPFIVMEYIEGVELTEAIREEAPMPPARALAIIRQLASVLQEAHRHSLVHRDLKPANLRLMRYVPGGAIYLKVLDFGIAKQVGPEGSSLTTSGVIIGTPRYMSPEQADTTLTALDGRADQYSAGVILYELLTGHPPFLSPSLPALLVAHLSKPPPPLPESIPLPVRELVERMLKKQPAERFADPDALERAITECEKLLSSGATSPGLRTAQAPSATPGSGRARWLIAGGAGLALCAVLTLLIASRGSVKPRPQEPPARPVEVAAPRAPDLGVVQAAAIPEPTEKPAAPGKAEERPARAAATAGRARGKRAPRAEPPAVASDKAKPPPRAETKEDDLSVPVLH